MDSEPRAALSSGDGMHRVVALPAFERRRPVVVAQPPTSPPTSVGVPVPRITRGFAPRETLPFAITPKLMVAPWLLVRLAIFTVEVPVFVFAAAPPRDCTMTDAPLVREVAPKFSTSAVFERLEKEIPPPSRVIGAAGLIWLVA